MSYTNNAIRGLFNRGRGQYLENIMGLKTETMRPKRVIEA